MKRTYQPSKIKRKRATGFRRPHENHGRQEGSCAPPLQGPQEDRSLNDRELVFSAAAMQPTPRRLGFGAELRLRSKLQFDAIYAGGRRIDDRFFATARQAQWSRASARSGLQWR